MKLNWLNWHACKKNIMAKATHPIFLDGSSQETFDKSFDNLLTYLDELSEESLTHDVVRCQKCKYVEPNMDYYTCTKCGHDTGISYDSKKFLDDPTRQIKKEKNDEN